jgi:glucose-6-phosphate dehydrogenase assembly protein OpcA
MQALEDVALSELEGALARLRTGSADAPGAPDVRMSTMTHLAWVPERWYEQALATLHGLAEQHPSRTILLVPEPDAAESRIDAGLDLQRFPLTRAGRRVCAEVIVLRLKGSRALAPASIVHPLLISDLPVFLRWRGEPAWSTPQFEQLVELADRLVVDSTEWDDVPYAYGKLRDMFERTAVSDLAWARTHPWRAALADRWPSIADARRLTVTGQPACALLLHGWLCSLLGSDLQLEHVPADDGIVAVMLDGDELPQPRHRPTASALLSAELDRESRDRVYETAALSSAP